MSPLQGKTQAVAGQSEWEIMIPKAPVKMVKAKGASGITGLEGKKVGLFWNTKPNGDVFLTRIGEHLKNRFPSIQVIEFMPGKADSAIGAPASALNEAANRCDVVVFSTGD